MTEYPTYAELRRRFHDAPRFRKKEMIEVGAAFASFSIMTATEQAEPLLRRWVAAGRPQSLAGLSDQLRETRERRLRSVHELDSFQVEWLSLLKSPFVDKAFAQLTWGYGPAKASFAMACAGLGTLPCIDRRIQRKYDIPDRDLDSWGRYLDVCERIYPGVEDKASAQALEWLHDLAAERYSTQHELLLGLPHPQLEFAYAEG